MRFGYNFQLVGPIEYWHKVNPSEVELHFARFLAIPHLTTEEAKSDKGTRDFRLEYLELKLRGVTHDPRPMWKKDLSNSGPYERYFYILVHEK